MHLGSKWVRDRKWPWDRKAAGDPYGIRNNQITLCTTRPRFNPCLGQPAWCYHTLFHLGSEPLCLQYIHGGPTFDPVGRCSHVTLMHEKTLLIQRIKSVFFKSESQSKVFSSKSQSKLFSKSESGSKSFFDALTTDQMCFSTRRHFFEEKLGWIKSVFSCISVMWLHQSTNFGWIKSWYPVYL